MSATKLAIKSARRSEMKLEVSNDIGTGDEV